MIKKRVAIVRCESYDEDEVYKALKKGIDLLGGVNKFFKKGERILLKPNVLFGEDPKKASLTHPAVFNAMIRVLKDRIKLVYGDSPGFGSSLASLKNSGMKKVADKYKIELGDFENGKNVDFPEGKICKKFLIANAFFNVDGVVNIPKMKTHNLTRISGAVKNQFGFVVGLNKAKCHARFPNSIAFSKMLVDLSLFLKTRLHVMDGIVAMEGNGPRAGNPISMNCLIISEDPVAVDATFLKMINFDPTMVPTCKYGGMYGLGTYNPKEIEYVGEDLEKFINKKFDIKKESLVNTTFLGFIPAFIRNWFASKPVIDSNKCVKCGICAKACPIGEKALCFQDKTKPPVYNYNNCIRCFCCQEMCPHRAIDIIGPFKKK